MRQNWRVDVFVRVALVLLIPARVVAQDAAGEDPREWGKVFGSYQMSIASNRTQYEVGEPIKIGSVLKNVSDHPIMLRRTTPETTYTMEILTPAQSWLPWRSLAALTPYGNKVKNPRMYSVAGVDIPPGSEEKNEFEISKIYEMSAPGEYSITFRCRQPTIRMSEMDGKEHPMVNVTSKIIVTVVPKQQ
jgi:hypothetical protein